MFEHPLSIRLKGILKMHERCPVCGQISDIEVGFYYGTGYVSYFIGIFISLASLLLWWLLIGFSFHDNRFLYWVVGNSIFLAVLQPWLMRFSRILWLSWFVHYDPEWRQHPAPDHERINKEQMGNW